MRWLMLPVSVGAHVIAALAILIVPLAAEVEWPAPAPLHSALVTTLAPVPPEVVKLAAPRRTVAAPSGCAGPLSLPRRYVPAVVRRSVDERGAPQALRSRLSRRDIGSSVAIAVPMVPDPPPPVRPAPVRAGQGVSGAEEDCRCDAGVSADRAQCAESKGQ